MKKTIIIAGMGMAVFVGWIILGPWGCEWTPERDNPLDPNSNSFNPVLTGEVTNLANTSISQAIVTLHPEGVAVVTGDDGVYRFEGVDLGEYALTVQKMDHVGDTVTVNIVSGGITTQDFQINALPVFDSVSVTSHNIYSLPQHNRHVTVYCMITDPDENKSLVSIMVLFEDDTLGFLQYDGVTGIFSRNFLDTTFSVISFQDIVGRPFTLIATDTSDSYSMSESYYTNRFLDIPNVISPVYDQVGRIPTLYWENFSNYFSYFQNIRIFDDDRILVWDTLAVDAAVTQVIVTDSLQLTSPPGPDNYYWTLEIIDLYGNTSVSQEAIFWVVQQ
jgi:hypothetical protein